MPAFFLTYSGVQLSEPVQSTLQLLARQRMLMKPRPAEGQSTSSSFLLQGVGFRICGLGLWVTFVFQGSIESSKMWR